MGKESDNIVKNRIKDALKHEGLKQKELADKLSIKYSTFNSYFSDSADKILTLDLVIKIGEALNVSPLWLAYGRGIYRLDEALSANQGKPIIAHMQQERVKYFSEILADYFDKNPDKNIISMIFIEDDGSAETIKIDAKTHEIVNEKSKRHTS